MKRKGFIVIIIVLFCIFLSLKSETTQEVFWLRCLRSHTGNFEVVDLAVLQIWLSCWCTGCDAEANKNPAAFL